MRRLSRLTMLIATALLFVAVSFPGLARAGEGHGIVVDLGNAKCPITGKKVNGSSFAVFKGLRIGLCCPACGKKLLADPETRLEKAGIKWKKAADLVARANKATSKEQKKLLATIEKQWKIVGAAAVAPATPSRNSKVWVVDLGNEKCPVLGGEVDGKTFTVWNGVRIGHCCAMCVGKLLANPEKILAKAGIDWQAASRTAARIANAKGADRAELLAAAKKKWHMVEVDAGPVVDLGNKKCPVRGGDVDGKTFTTWNGLKIGHCCPMCVTGFLAHPAELLDKAGIAWRSAAKAVAEVRNAKGKERAKLLAALKKKFKVAGE